MEFILAFALIFLVYVAASIFLFRRNRLELDKARAQAALLQRAASSYETAWRQAESLLEQLLAHGADAVLVSDAGRRIIRCSLGAEQIFGVPAEKAVGRPFIEVTMDAELDRLLRSSLSSMATQAGTVRLALNHKVLEATATCVVEDSKAAYALVVLKDVTDLRRLETARREFVANISHELRVPLAAIKVMVETLQDGALSDRKAASRFLSQINAEVDNLTQLVRELLELSRIESGQKELRLAAINVNEMVEKAAERIKAQADHLGLQVGVETLPSDPVVVLDEERMGQVVLNLLHNAIKFTPRGGKVTVRVRRDMEDASPVLSISIEDTGVGIPEEDLPRIFERFYKVDKARKRGEGTGLGLAIAKHIVQAHGGQIWAESGEGKGSTFTFKIPWKSTTGA